MIGNYFIQTILLICSCIFIISFFLVGNQDFLLKEVINSVYVNLIRINAKGWNSSHLSSCGLSSTPLAWYLIMTLIQRKCNSLSMNVLGCMQEHGMCLYIFVCFKDDYRSQTIEYEFP